MIILLGLGAMSCYKAIWGNFKIVKALSYCQVHGACSNEIIDLDSKDIFSKRSFTELMQEQHKHDLPYIIARIVSKGDAGELVRYCNAHHLNKLFGGYPFKNDKTPHTQKSHKKGFPVHHIEYYVINDPHDSAFQYFCSYNDLMINKANKNNFRIMFYANQISDSALHVDAQQQLASDEKCDPHVRAKAQMRLGDIYCEGRYDMPKDYEKARFYFEQAAIQDVNASIALCARRKLDQLYYRGDCVASGYQKGRSYFATKRSGFTRAQSAYYVW